MDLAQLQTRLRQLGVRPKDTYRAALYIDYLNDADTYFKTTLAGTVEDGGFGNDYPFVASALGSADLLQQLADILDHFVSPAIKADLKLSFAQPPGGLGHGDWTYQDYFTNVILNADKDKFRDNVHAFRVTYPISAAALLQLSRNFKGNICEACLRVIADKALLTRFYADLYENDFTIPSLQKIKSTGSDFHKGGKQVLILTFQIVHIVDYPTGPIVSAPIRELLKVVYKPSDLEADCLIAGDSAVVNRALGITFMAASLFEIYNQRLQLIKTNDPDFTGEPVTTYRILPRKYMSAYTGGYPLPIRDAYGYIQYLDNDLSGTAARVFGYYPLGASDYLIFKRQDEKAIVGSFYRQEGALVALCGSFSLVDMHIENLRVMTYKPYLIDLEVCLTSTIAGIDDTQLLGTSGGITGISIGGQDFDWVVVNATTPGKASLDRKNLTVYYQNRLWSAVANRRKKTVAVSVQDLMQGFFDGMQVLRTCEQNKDFKDWFLRLDKVLVRYLTYGTRVFREIRNNIFISQLSKEPSAPLDQAEVAELRYNLTQEYNKFKNVGNRAADPDFVSLTQPVSGPDLLNLDIPVFYHRIGTKEIVDSRGGQVPIPQSVTIDNAAGGTLQAPVLGSRGVFDRDTFFANQPTQTIVDRGQVQVLGGDGFYRRESVLTLSILGALGTNNDNPPGNIVGIDERVMS